jgi:hypothetical protein
MQIEAANIWGKKEKLFYRGCRYFKLRFHFEKREFSIPVAVALFIEANLP